MAEGSYSAIIGLAAGITFVVAAMAIFSTGSTTANENNLGIVAVPDDLVISQERSACLGTCPVYQLQIYGNGTVYYEGRAFVSPTGVHLYNISRSEIAKLVSESNRIGFYSLNDRYGTFAFDASTSHISILMNENKKDVVIAFGSVPEELQELQNKIEKAAGIKNIG